LAKLYASRKWSDRNGRHSDGIIIESTMWISTGGKLLGAISALSLWLGRFSRRQKNAGHRDERRDGLLFPPEQRRSYNRSSRFSRVFLGILCR
jgi:hypothetical protein